MPPAIHRGLPSPYLTLIITLDDPLTVTRHPDPADAPGDYVTLAGGLQHTTPAVIAHPGRQSGIQLALSPLGARALLGRPAGELAGIDVDASDVLGPAARELHERLREAEGWPARFALLDQILLAGADLDQRVAPDIAEAWRLLTRSGGTIQAGELARRVGWSPRYLQRRLLEETVVYGDGDVVHHAQLSWPPGGGVMLGSVRENHDEDSWPVQPGTFGAYAVTDDPDALFARASAAGADFIDGLHETDYGSRDFAVRDPEGNRWSFGTYRGEPRKTT